MIEFEHPTLLLLSILFAPILIGYAEIHFRIPGIPGRLFKKAPEIIFDLPHRAQNDAAIPLFLFIKDAHRFPVELLELEVDICLPNQKKSLKTWRINLNQSVREKFFSRVFLMPPDHFSLGKHTLIATLTYRVGAKTYRLRQDNYSHIPHHPFSIYIADEPLPSLPGLQWGDLHIHSNYTDDAVEFGAPIRETALCARVLGLDFIAITDHSFDLDNDPDDYFKKDPQLRKWQHFQREIKQLNEEFHDVTILPGEEVSTGNSRGQNVHCLLIGNRNFYPGCGDSGDKIFNHRPTTMLPELIKNVRQNEQNALIIAAHPFDEPPFSNRIILNRGRWHPKDLQRKALDFWQILNGRVDKYFHKGLAAWKKSLLAGNKTGIISGTDAHGNFNCFRQIKTPFFKMIYHREQLLGQTRSGVFSEKPLTHANLTDILRKKRVIISNGPAAALTVLQTDQKKNIGDTIKSNTHFQIDLAAASSKEFGYLHKIKLITGDFHSGKEIVREINPGYQAFHFGDVICFEDGLKSGYIRLKVQTTKNQRQNFCLTNPIWIE